jgi:hypothetical protein
MRPVSVAAVVATGVLAATPIPGMAVDVVAPEVPDASDPTAAVDPEDLIPGGPPPATETAGHYRGERVPGYVVPSGPAPPLTRRDMPEIEKHRDVIRRFWAMSPAQTAQAKRIVARDKRLAKLLDGRTYKVTRMGPWLLCCTRTYAGALVDIELSKPLKSKKTRTLPVINATNGGRSYVQVPFKLKILRADKLTVYVDFSKNALVSIEPALYSKVEYVKGGHRKFPSSGGGR